MKNGPAGAFMCACAVLTVSGSSAIPSDCAEKGRLTRFSFPGFLDLRTIWSS